jgi:subtilisin family serine protease
MKLGKITIGVLIVLGFQLLSSIVGVDPSSQAQAATIPTPQIVYSLYNIQDQAAIIRDYNLSSPKALKSPKSFSAQLASGQDPALVAAQMSADGRISTASPNLTIGYSENRSSFNFDPSSFNFDGSSSPYALYQARYQWAWLKTGLLTSQRANWGQGIKVAVLDTGVDYLHPELKGKVLTGYDAFTGRYDGKDVQGHGTFVAGVILQIAPGATIIPVRVLDENGIGSLTTVMNGLQYALDAGANVINLSLSSDTDIKALHQLIQTARSKGVLVVSAAGNNDSPQKYYPAGYSEGMGIAATEMLDYNASFTNYNNYMSLSAPGVNIYSMWKGGGYGWGNGTSFSTPMVAAGAAIIKALHPTYTPDQLKAELEKAVDGFGIGCKCKGLGTGRLNFTKIT